MTQPIRLHSPQARDSDPSRLNLFAGRAMTEREFELLQAYVDDRITPIASLLPLGIVSGLEVHVSGAGSEARLRITPGRGVGAGGRLVRLHTPLIQDWPGLAALVARESDSALWDGFYFLTLRSRTEQIDPLQEHVSCTRNEPDPLAERRHEIVALPGLQWIGANAEWMVMSPIRAANQICVHFLDEANSPFDARTGALPLALVKVVAGAPNWIDPIVGRYLAEPHGKYRNFLVHGIAVWREWARTGAASISLPLGQVLGVDFLPAAGPFGASLIEDLAAQPPRLAFAPADLRIDMVPVPASAVADVVEAELQRGVVDLLNGRGDHLRILLAIPDLDYRRNLLDLPQRDREVEHELIRRHDDVARAWGAWRTQWQALFGELTNAELVGVPALVGAPAKPRQIRESLLKARQARLATGQALPEPWRGVEADPVSDTSITATAREDGAGLLRQRRQLQETLRTLDADLDESFRLLNEVNDYLGLQRQQLDHLSVSFTALAGGVAGDGSGSSLMRWVNNAVLTPNALKKEAGNG